MIMGYWVSLVEPDRKHHKIVSMDKSISYNYSDLMSHLPCDRVRDWQGKQAEDMQLPVTNSLNLLLTDQYKYQKYELDQEHHYGTIDVCIEILRDALQLFIEHPSGIIVVD